MFDEISNIPILKPALKKPNRQPGVKYTRSDAMRNIYKAKVNNITKKRGK
jgi:hypothetical protein|tara:strand:+ start:208 stop:357 length:150 start_codon:yes stop_codon:yes gene_type:complete